MPPKKRKRSVLDSDDIGHVVDPDGDVTTDGDICARCGLTRDLHTGEPGDCKFYEADDDS